MVVLGEAANTLSLQVGNDDTRCTHAAVIAAFDGALALLDERERLLFAGQASNARATGN
jgi:hypothetical protein